MAARPALKNMKLDTEWLAAALQHARTEVGPWDDLPTNPKEFRPTDYDVELLEKALLHYDPTPRDTVKPRPKFHRMEFPTLATLKDVTDYEVSSGDTKSKTRRLLQCLARYDHQGIDLGPLFRCGDVESYSNHGGVKRKNDLYSIFDLQVIEPGVIRGIQACAGDWQPHIEKLREHLETCELWLSSGATTIELWGWRKVKRFRKGQTKGKKMSTYRPRLQYITMDFLKGLEPAEIIEVFGKE